MFSNFTYITVTVYLTTFESLIVCIKTLVGPVMCLKGLIIAAFKSSEPLHLLRLMGVLVPSLHRNSNYSLIHT